MPPDKLTQASNTGGGEEPWRQKYPSRAAGYVAPYKLRNRPVTSALSLEEHAALTALAARENKSPGQKATELIRAFIHDDDFEDATLVYGDGEQ